MQEIAIKDKLLEEMFGIGILGITEDEGKITLNFFGNGHRDIEIEIKPLDMVGSGAIMTQEAFDERVKNFEDLLK